MKKSGLAHIFAVTAAASAVAALGAVISLSPLPGNVFAAEGTLSIGYKATDGTIYAGISPNTNKLMYTTPADAPLTDTQSGAGRYCTALQTSGHHDWRVPTKDELNALYQNRDAGKLKGTFNETGLHSAGWYWSSSSPNGTDDATYWGWAQRFSDGFQYVDYGENFASSLRCVR